MIYPIQTGTVRVKQFQLTGSRHNLSRLYQLMFTQKWGEWMPIYSWLIKLDNQLLMVDTGETAKIYEKSYLPNSGLYHKAVQTKITKEEEIPTQIKKLGFKVEDVHTVILTHLHGDHIGGIEHFPHATFLVSQAEYDMATSKKGKSNGYFTKNWPSWFKPQLVNYDTIKEGVFDKSYRLNGNSKITIVPTPGHSVGHQSVIVKSGDLRYFIGGDLTFNRETLKAEIPNVILMNKQAKASVIKAHKYVTSNSCVYLSSHDWEVSKLLNQE